jgi:RNA polymerase sigma factor (sigma-70 family)
MSLSVVDTRSRNFTKSEMNSRELHTDEELVLRLQEGDRDAFAIIYQRYFLMLFRYLEKNLDRREDCEEIVQDTFVALLRREHGEPIRSLREYLFSSVRFGMLRFFEKEKLKKRYEDHFLLFAETYDSQLERDELLIDRISRLISPLPERSQLALMLRLSDNLSNDEIAAKMKISKRTVEWHIFKAMSFLRRHKTTVIEK